MLGLGLLGLGLGFELGLGLRLDLGLGLGLHSDQAPLVSSALAFLVFLESYVACRITSSQEGSQVVGVGL